MLGHFKVEIRPTAYGMMECHRIKGVWDIMEEHGNIMYGISFDGHRMTFQGSKIRVSSCPRRQKISEYKHKLRCGCPPDHQIFWGVKHYLIILISTISPHSFLFQYKYQFDN